jgi:hypothetical protein
MRIKKRVARRKVGICYIPRPGVKAAMSLQDGDLVLSEVVGSGSQSYRPLHGGVKSIMSRRRALYARIGVMPVQARNERPNSSVPMALRIIAFTHATYSPLHFLAQLIGDILQQHSHRRQVRHTKHGSTAGRRNKRIWTCYVRPFSRYSH